MKPRAAAVAATVALAGCGTTTGAPTPDQAIPGVDTVSLAAPQPIVTNTTGTSPAVPAWPATLAGGATDRDGTQIAGLVAEVDPDGQLLTLTLTTPDHRIEAVRTDRTWWARGGPAEILADGAVNPHGWYQLDDLDDLDRIVPVGLGTLTDRLEVASRLEGSLTSHAGAVTVTVDNPEPLSRWRTHTITITGDTITEFAATRTDHTTLLVAVAPHTQTRRARDGLGVPT